jgi:hypothetical protein
MRNSTRTYYKTGLLFVTAILFSFGIKAQFTSIEDFCISEDEKKIYNSIISFRADSNLSDIDLSRALCYTANTHVKDLYLNKPHKNGCTLYAWSNRGRWESFCFDPNEPDFEGMYSKPKELTYYRNKATEYVSWDNQNPSIDLIIAELFNDPNFRNFILAKKKWSKKTWRAIGIGYYEGYLSIWLGEKDDLGVIPVVCSDKEIQTEQVTKVKKAPGFLLIIESHSNISRANKSVKALKAQGYINAKVIASKGKFRVSLNEFVSMKEAEKEKKRIASKYKGAWILKEK